MMKNHAEADRNAIAKQIEEFIRAYEAGDLDGVMDYYSPDMIKLRQNASPESRAETRERVAGVFRYFSGRLSVINDEIVASGDLAYTRGTLKLTLTPRAGSAPPLVVERRFLEIWRRSGGRWLVARAMDNAGP
jgi:ketosteroid isomerase-like protein